jgi:hypothetical protein
MSGGDSLSDRFSPASAASISDLNEQVCEYCGNANRTTTVDGSLLGIGPESRAIPTCAPWWATPKAADADRGGRGDLIQQVRQNSSRSGHYRCPCRCHASTSSAAASRAKISPMPERALGSPVHGRVFGPSTQDSFASYDPDTSSWRTSQLCLDGDLDEFSETWPRAGTTRNGIAYQQQPLAPLTGATGSGLLPTPENRGSVAGWPTPTGSVAQLGESPESWLALTIAVQIWPTPTAGDSKNTANATAKRRNPDSRHHSGTTLVDAVRMWPTPTKSDGEGGPGVSNRRKGGKNLRTAVRGQLNPTWVEWLMGFPLGWTDLGR